MDKPVIVFVGSSTPIQKILPRILGQDAVKVAAVFGDMETDLATQEICRVHHIAFLPMLALKGSDGVINLKRYAPDWVFNINSMILFGEALLAVPTQGSLNLHCGNLPAYAGKHAHQWAIRRGEEEFGVTLHWMTTHIDGGDIAGIRYFPITPRDTGLSLYMKYIKEGIPLVEEILSMISHGKGVPRVKQDQSKRHYFLDKEALDGRILWEGNQKEILDFFRAANYAPFQSPTYVPVAKYEGVEVIMGKAKAAEGESGVPGKILSIEPKGLVVGTATDPIWVRKVLPSEEIEFGVGRFFQIGGVNE